MSFLGGCGPIPVIEVTSFQSAYGPRYPVRVDASASDENGPGAVQSFKDEANINNIMAKFQRTGALEWVERNAGQYEDVSGVDFNESMDTVVRAREMFEELPSSIRDKFRNDPAAFFDFVNDPAHIDELRELGLAKPVVPPPAPLQVEVVAPKAPE